MISDYHFGSITIDGQTYDHDVEVRWDGEVLKWWRDEGHTIDSKSVKRALEAGPETIVIGNGASGCANVLDEVRTSEVVVEKTAEAVDVFNGLQKDGQKVIGLFHLTC